MIGAFRSRRALSLVYKYPQQTTNHLQYLIALCTWVSKGTCCIQLSFFTTLVIIAAKHALQQRQKLYGELMDTVSWVWQAQREHPIWKVFSIPRIY